MSSAMCCPQTFCTEEVGGGGFFIFFILKEVSSFPFLPLLGKDGHNGPAVLPVWCLQKKTKSWKKLSVHGCTERPLEKGMSSHF